MLNSNYFRRILGIVIIVAAIATFAVIIRYFIDNARKDDKNLSKSVSTDISMKTIHFTESHQNQNKWELFAESGIYDKPADKTSLEDIRFIVERDPKNGPVTVTARHGEYLHKAKAVQLNGNVRATTRDGMTFETEQISYDSTAQTFTTTRRIRLIDAALSVDGVGMELSVDKQRATVKGNVEATVYPGKRGK